MPHAPFEKKKSHAIYMYFGEMESMGLSLASILGMHPSTAINHLSNTTSHLPELVSLGPMYHKEGHFLYYTVTTCYLYVFWRDGKHRV